MKYTLWMERKNTKKERRNCPQRGRRQVLRLENILSGPLQEAVLKVILNTEDDRSASYYTRIIRPDDLTVSECLAFAQDFHAKALAGDEAEELGTYLEPGEESDNTTYADGEYPFGYHPYPVGRSAAPGAWQSGSGEIKEANSVYTSLLAEYQTACTADSGETEVYSVSEFFRVRYVEGTVYLLDYNREMEQIFDGGSQAFDNDSILFGIVPDEMQYETNKEGTVVSFVQGRNLWLYETEDSHLIQIFSFADQEGADVRSTNPDHTVPHYQHG